MENVEIEEIVCLKSIKVVETNTNTENEIVNFSILIRQDNGF